jgi:hypothetical protein
MSGSEEQALSFSIRYGPVSDIGATYPPLLYIKIIFFSQAQKKRKLLL